MRNLLLGGLLSAAAVSAQAEQLTIDRIFGGGSLTGPAPNRLKIAPDGARVTFLRAKADDQNTFDLWEYNLRSGKTQMLVDSRRLAPDGEQLSDVEKARRERARTAGRHGIVDYVWAPDGRRLLFPLGGKLYLYDLAAARDKALRELDAGGDAVDPQISPRGRYVSFVHEQNLWLIDLADGKRHALTHDGGGSVHNGEAEFVAQEEMARFHGYWWAPDESAIAFERFDEANVPLVQRFEIYADRSAVVEQRY
ncbi:MAG TPA: DPP IV N-terminal domain-containing protein, partial [Rudaea sp.]